MKVGSLDSNHGCCLRQENGGRTPEYMVWQALVQRCTNPKAKKWECYGGRGITVCTRWLKFSAFLEDMGRRPGLGLEIERIDNNVGYQPGNCYWATRKEQTRNTRRNRFLTLNGLTLCLTDWAKRQGLTLAAIRKRIKLGWNVEDTLNTPLRSGNKPSKLTRSRISKSVKYFWNRR